MKTYDSFEVKEFIETIFPEIKEKFYSWPQSQQNPELAETILTSFCLTPHSNWLRIMRYAKNNHKVAVKIALKFLATHLKQQQTNRKKNCVMYLNNIDELTAVIEDHRVNYEKEYLIKKGSFILQLMRKNEWKRLNLMDYRQAYHW